MRSLQNITDGQYSSALELEQAKLASDLLCRTWTKPVNVKRRLQTEDSRLGVKCRLRVKRRLKTADQG